VRRFLKDLLNVPNTMSLVRLLSSPLLLVFWLGLEWRVTALVIGTVGGITDLFDGIVARKLKQVTEVGALIDQLGDLVFESICLIIAVLTGELWVGWLVIYLFREFTVTVIRTYVYGHGGQLPSTVMGKAKSSLFQYAFFAFFLGAILLQPGVVPDSYAMIGIPPGRILIWVALASIMTGFAISLLSGWHYIRAFVRFYVERQTAAGPPAE
jgi:CDP-diacylglycerol--glycerol-3-phosphate 3-phosphatidyltransferase